MPPGAPPFLELGSPRGAARTPPPWRSSMQQGHVIRVVSASEFRTRRPGIDGGNDETRRSAPLEAFEVRGPLLGN